MAFRRLDFNRDGFLTEEDFLEVSWWSKIILLFSFAILLPTPLRNIISLQIQWPLVQGDVESSQLQRIFQHCDQVGTG